MLNRYRIALAILLAAPVFGADKTLPSSQGLTAHEWGTFTSVAGSSGEALSWVPLNGSSDLPCFVHRMGPSIVKALSFAIERMETPVVYFYTAKKSAVSLRADLPSGLITEWYPQAASAPNTGRGGGSIEWNMELMPGSTPDLPMTTPNDHYFAARETDAVPLRASGEAEKMLFYRGVASFASPLAAQFMDNGQLELRPRSAAIGFAMLFDNRGGKTGYRIIRDLHASQRVDMPELSSDSAAVRRELAQALTQAGLYEKEAAAMVATWKDAWFEEGTRLFYLTPRSVVDEVLPLHIAPTPQAIERVFVGRIELLPQYRKQILSEAIAKTDKGVLDQFGRFYSPFIQMMNAKPAVETQQYMNAKNAEAVRKAMLGCGK
jgi:hypothetical protein